MPNRHAHIKIPQGMVYTAVSGSDRKEKSSNVNNDATRDSPIIKVFLGVHTSIPYSLRYLRYMSRKIMNPAIMATVNSLSVISNSDSVSQNSGLFLFGRSSME